MAQKELLEQIDRRRREALEAFEQQRRGARTPRVLLRHVFSLGPERHGADGSARGASGRREVTVDNFS